MGIVDNRSRLYERSENAKRESKYLDFKSEFDTASSGAWCELIKDIVAFANSGGGVIVFGINNDGSNAGTDLTRIREMDLADITNKLYSYTGYHFEEIEIVEVERAGQRLAAFMISSTEVPIVFTRPGTYDVGGGKQKCAFAQGAVYFRHGAKSEPGTEADLRKWRDRAIENIRASWMDGIGKVVEAPAGHSITVIASPSSGKKGAPRLEGMAITANVSAGPGAVQFVPQNAEEIWPHRQKNLLTLVNKNLDVQPAVNGHDILCINSKLDILKSHPEFAYKPHSLASPQYSNKYADWIIDQYKEDPRFFQRMREEYRKRVLSHTDVS
jgi:hypothetical protein